MGLNRAPFLVEKQIDEQPVLQFFHRQVAQVAREQHCHASKTELHAVMADFCNKIGQLLTLRLPQSLRPRVDSGSSFPVEGVSGVRTSNRAFRRKIGGPSKTCANPY
jgi:hypothetical protein